MVNTWALQIIGLILLMVGLFMVNPWLCLAAFGLALVVVGLASELKDHA